MALFTAKDKQTGASVDVLAVTPSFIAGVRAASFLVYDIRVGNFKWMPSLLFTYDDGGFTPTIRVEDVMLDVFNITIDEGDTKTLTATIVPADAANKNVTWTVSDSDYLTIVPNGLTCEVTAKRSGRATVTVTTEDNNRSATATIFIPVTQIYVNQIDFLPASPQTIGVDEGGTITALTAPTNAANRVVNFSIISGGDHVRITPISNNYISIFGVEPGPAVIRATAQDAGGFSADYTVNVVNETTANVANYDEFIAAVNNAQIDTIHFTHDIDVTDTVTISRTIIIDGDNFNLNYSGTPKDGLVIMGDNSIVRNLILNFTGAPADWQGLYGLQVYNAENVVISSVRSKGEDGGFLINGSTVSMSATIDVSDNEFGGIEVSRGSAATRNSTLNITNATLVNNTEAYAKPTIWVENGQGSVIGAENMFSIQLNNQTQYYLKEANTIEPGAEQDT